MLLPSANFMTPYVICLCTQDKKKTEFEEKVYKFKLQEVQRSASAPHSCAP